MKIRKKIRSRSKSKTLTVSFVPLILLLNLAPTLLPHPTLHLTLASALSQKLDSTAMSFENQVTYITVLDSAVA